MICTGLKFTDASLSVFAGYYAKSQSDVTLLSFFHSVLINETPRRLLFDTTAPVVFEELTYLAETHGYNASHGPPCVCVLSFCLPCLKNLADRLVPTCRPRPPDRVPPDYSFLRYSAKALRAQGLLSDFKKDGWEDQLKAAQDRTGDELWRIAMEINLEKVSREFMNSLHRINHEVRFFPRVFPPDRCVI